MLDIVVYISYFVLICYGLFCCKACHYHSHNNGIIHVWITLLFVFFIYRGAISYVSCCYTVVSIILVFLLFIQQIILISQNITIQEFNRSIQRRSAAGERVSWWRSLYISDNPYNMSLRSNWLTFIRRTRHEPIVPSANEEDLIEW